jgi:hypothetical protein
VIGAGVGAKVGLGEIDSVGVRLGGDVGIGEIVGLGNGVFSFLVVVSCMIDVGGGFGVEIGYAHDVVRATNRQGRTRLNKSTDSFKRIVWKWDGAKSLLKFAAGVRYCRDLPVDRVPSRPAEYTAGRRRIKIS